MHEGHFFTQTGIFPTTSILSWPTLFLNTLSGRTEEVLSSQLIDCIESVTVATSSFLCRLISALFIISTLINQKEKYEIHLVFIGDSDSPYVVV